MSGRTLVQTYCQPVVGKDKILTNMRGLLRLVASISINCCGVLFRIPNATFSSLGYTYYIFYKQPNFRPLRKVA